MQVTFMTIDQWVLLKKRGYGNLFLLKYHNKLFFIFFCARVKKKGF